MKLADEVFLTVMQEIRNRCHQNSKDKGFWDEGERHDTIECTNTGSTTRVITKTKPWSFGEKIALVHSELSEMFEAWRKNVGHSEKDIEISLIHGMTRRITAIEEEVADVFIRMFDLCGKLDIDIGQVILAKMAYNATREHMHGGRKC